MLHFWKSAKLFMERANHKDLTLLRCCLCALGVLIGILAPRRKKMQTGVLAGGVFAATCVPLLNKYFDISDELMEEKQKK